MEKERLKFCIDRFDHYYDSINNKSAVFLALGTFIVGGMVASYPFLKVNVNCTFGLQLLLLLTIAFGLAAMITIIIAVTPYLSKKGSSMFYFNSISTKENKEFAKESMNYKEEDELADLRIQVYDLASGLRKKYLRLRIAGIFFTIMFFIIIPLIVLIIINLK
jgi:hypothetical protein